MKFKLDVNFLGNIYNASDEYLEVI